MEFTSRNMPEIVADILDTPDLLRRLTNWTPSGFPNPYAASAPEDAWRARQRLLDEAEGGNRYHRGSPIELLAQGLMECDEGRTLIRQIAADEDAHWMIARGLPISAKGHSVAALQLLFELAVESPRAMTCTSGEKSKSVAVGMSVDSHFLLAMVSSDYWPAIVATASGEDSIFWRSAGHTMHGLTTTLCGSIASNPALAEQAEQLKGSSAAAGLADSYGLAPGPASLEALAALGALVAGTIMAVSAASYVVLARYQLDVVAQQSPEPDRSQYDRFDRIDQLELAASASGILFSILRQAGQPGAEAYAKFAQQTAAVLGSESDEMALRQLSRQIPDPPAWFGPGEVGPDNQWMTAARVQRADLELAALQLSHLGPGTV